MGDKINYLTDMYNAEKEEKEIWGERYEKEYREHHGVNAQLLEMKSTLKDQILQTKNTEIKLTSVTKNNEVLSESL